MTDCTKYKSLIEKYLDGIITEAELAELKSHAQTCPPCREEFSRCALMQKAIGQAFSSETTAERAKTALLERLAVEVNRFVSTAWFVGRRAAVAAGVLFVIGLFLGLVIGRTGKPARAPLSVQVPISAGKIEGTVLVRHEGSDVWQTLKTGSKIYLGDTFHAAANSTCVLKLSDESTIELDQNSMMALRSYSGQTQFFLEHGECTANLESPHGPFFVSTPHGRVEALGTEFTVTVE